MVSGLDFIVMIVGICRCQLMLGCCFEVMRGLAMMIGGLMVNIVFVFRRHTILLDCLECLSSTHPNVRVIPSYDALKNSFEKLGLDSRACLVVRTKYRAAGQSL